MDSSATTALDVIMRVCRVCDQTKALAEFYVREGGKHRTECKDCTKERVAKSPSKLSVKRLLLNEHPGARPHSDQESAADGGRSHREDLAEWAQAHPDQMRSYRTAWQKRNPESGRQTSARHLARKQGNDFREVSARDIRRMIARYRGLCAYCQRRPWQHLDHVIPLSLGGRHSIGNILPACAHCNQRKSDRLLSAWRRR